MRIVYRGCIYDTTKARLIKHRSSGDAGSDSHWQAGLYQKKYSSHKWFLYGHGGPMTIFRGAERIIPVQEWEAKEWLNGNDTN